MPVIETIYTIQYKSEEKQNEFRKIFEINASQLL